MSPISIFQAEAQALRLALSHCLAALVLPPYSMRRLRALCFRLGGADIAVGAEICGGVRMTGRTVRIGKGSFLGAGALIEANTSASVVIGSNVAIGPGVSILTSTHEIGDAAKRAGPSRAKSVTVESGAWIGAGATILPGVTIGRGAVVAAGTVVYCDVAPSMLVGGQPLRTIRELSSS